MATAPISRQKVSVLGKKPLGTGMDFQTITERFLRSRQSGTAGAKVENRDSSIENYSRDLDTFFSYLREELHIGRYEEVRRPHVEAFVSYTQNRISNRTKKRLSKSSKNHMWRTLKTFFGWVERDPECKAMRLPSYADSVPVITANDQRLYVPSVEELEEFIAAIPSTTFDGVRDRLAMAMMADVGLRIGEMCWMRLDAIKWDTAQLLVPKEGKTEERLVPFDIDRLGPMLRGYLTYRETKVIKGSSGEPFLFITRLSGQCSANTFDQSFRRFRSRSGVGVTEQGNLSPHTMRHFFCTHYLMGGGTIAGLQRITGHQSVNTLMKYLHMAQQMGFVAEEHRKASPLKKLTGITGKKTRKVR